MVLTVFLSSDTLYSYFFPTIQHLPATIADNVRNLLVYPQRIDFQTKNFLESFTNVVINVFSQNAYFELGANITKYVMIWITVMWFAFFSCCVQLYISQVTNQCRTVVARWRCLQARFLTLTSRRFWLSESLPRKTFPTCTCHDGINVVIQWPRGGTLDADTGEKLL